MLKLDKNEKKLLTIPTAILTICAITGIFWEKSNQARLNQLKNIKRLISEHQHGSIVYFDNVYNKNKSGKLTSGEIFVEALEDEDVDILYLDGQVYTEPEFDDKVANKELKINNHKMVLK